MYDFTLRVCLGNTSTSQVKYFSRRMASVLHLTNRQRIGINMQAFAVAQVHEQGLATACLRDVSFRITYLTKTPAIF